VTGMAKDEYVGVVAVPDRVLDAFAEILIDRIDQLLDRLTDRALAAPTPGSAVWESEWNDRDTDSGRARARERSRIRTELVRRAGSGLGMIGSAPPPHPARKPGVRATRGRVDDRQLAFF
jgi:hypothetical protein